MMLWIVIALIMALSLATCLWFLRATADQQQGSEDQQALSFYNKQLEQIDAEQADQSLDPSQAEQARLELKRRMLRLIRQSKLQQGGSEAINLSGQQGHLFLGAIMLLASCAAVGLYMIKGQSDLPSYAYEQRLTAPLEDDLVMRAFVIEKRLRDEEQSLSAKERSDLWEQAAILHMQSLKSNGMEQLGQSAESAVKAMRNAVNLDAENASKHIQYAGLILELTQGQPVPALASAAIQRAYQLEPDNPSVFFYLGVIALRDQRADIAQKAFETVLAQVESDSELKAEIEQYIRQAQQLQSRLELKAASEQRPAGPSQEDIANAANMSEQDRNAMIRGMVDNLAAKLADQPDDLAGWRRLINAYNVLGETQKRKEAIASLLAQLPDKQSQDYLNWQAELEASE